MGSELVASNPNPVLNPLVAECLPAAGRESIRSPSAGCDGAAVSGSERRSLQDLACNLSMRSKLAVLVICIGLAAVVVETALFAVYQRHTVRTAPVAEANAMAGSLDTLIGPALAGNDTAAIGVALRDLGLQPNVLAAAVYDPRGHLVGGYRRADERGPVLPPLVPSVGLATAPSTLPGFGPHALLLFRPMVRDGRPIGSLALVYDLAPTERQLRSHFHTGLWLLLVSVVARVIIVYFMTSLVTRHLTYLSEVARGITARRDYSVRAQRRTGGEIGVLIDAFNQMLDHIQSEDLARRATEQQLRQSEERYALAARGSNDGLWDFDASTGYSYLSPRLNAMYGRPERESWMTMEEWMDLIHPADRHRVVTEITAFGHSDRSTLSLEYRIRHADGSYRWMLSHGVAVRDAEGVPLRIAGSQSDITQAKTADAGTGIPNRLYFLDAVEEGMRREAGTLGVVVIDIDNFSLIVGSLGRLAADDLIAQLAGRLRALARLLAAAHPALLARTGEDEFALLLAPPSEESAAVAVAGRILETLREPFFIEDQRLSVTASIGIAFGSPGDTTGEVLQNAEAAKCHASTQGRGQFAVFDRAMRESTAVRLEVVTGLRRAIAGNQLRLHYQPIVSVRDRTIVGFESLVRWQHPQRGLLAPGAFIPIAEESDLILDIGQWVLREACRQMAEWHERFPSESPLTVGVNLSAKQMNEPHFAEEVALVLRQTGLDPRMLRLEITESALMSNTGDALATLGGLKRMQVGLVIDDFGTGYSSLSYLQRLPFTVMKIDQSFIQELGAGDGSPEIVRTILQLGRSLHLRVIAEGVETAEQLARVSALGCDFVQGFYFSRPLDPEHTEELIRDRDARLPRGRVGNETIPSRDSAAAQQLC